MRAHRVSTRACRTTSLLRSYKLFSMLATSRTVHHAESNLFIKSCGLEARVSYGQTCSSAAAQYIVGQAGERHKPRRAFIVGLAGLLSSGCSWQAALVRIKRVEEAALATPHRTWPWPLMAARPHPIRPRPARPKATVHAPPGATFDVDCYRNSRQQAQLLKQQVKNKTTKRPTPTSCRNSLSHRYDGTRPESTGLSAGTEQRRVQPVSQTTKRPTTTFCRTSR